MAMFTWILVFVYLSVPYFRRFWLYLDFNYCIHIACGVCQEGGTKRSFFWITLFQCVDWLVGWLVVFYVPSTASSFQCCQNILYLKYYNLFWQSLRIILYLYFISVKYFKNTLLWDKIV